MKRRKELIRKRNVVSKSGKELKPANVRVFVGYRITNNVINLEARIVRTQVNLPVRVNNAVLLHLKAYAVIERACATASFNRKNPLNGLGIGVWYGYRMERSSAWSGLAVPGNVLERPYAPFVSKYVTHRVVDEREKVVAINQ